MKLIEKIKILGRAVKVFSGETSKEEGKAIFGEWESARNQIILNEKLIKKYTDESTGFFKLHEEIHGILDISGCSYLLSDPDSEETLVVLLTEALWQLGYRR